MYKASENRNGIVVGVNAGHGTSGGSSVKTLCHPDGSAKTTGGSTAATKSDKKMQGNQIRFILLKSLGEAVVDKTVTMDEMREALDFVCQDA